LKALKKPPDAIDMTFTCVLHMLCEIDSNVPVDNKGKLNTKDTWKTALGCMKDPKAFLETLNSLKGHIDGDTIKAWNFNNPSNTKTLADE